MNPKQEITTLFLDIGGVLLTNGWDHRLRTLAAKRFELDPKEFETRHNLTFGTYELGKISLDEYLNRVIFYKNRNFSKNEFKQFMFEESKPFPQMIDLICKLKEKHALKLAVVSNEGRELNEYRINKFKLGSYIDLFISSCYVHFRKPDEDIFRLALDIAQASPEQVVYIEDRLMFVQVAEGLNIRSIHHEDYESTKAKLDSFGLKL